MMKSILNLIAFVSWVLVYTSESTETVLLQIIFLALLILIGILLPPITLLILLLSFYFSYILNRIREKCLGVLEWLHYIPIPHISISKAIKSSPEFASQLTSHFISMSPDVVMLTWIAIGFAMSVIANTTDNITIAHVIEYCGGFMEQRQILAVLFEGWNVSRDVLNMEPTVSDYDNFFNFRRAIIASYVPGQGITGYWISAYLHSLNQPWARQVAINMYLFKRPGDISL